MQSYGRRQEGQYTILMERSEKTAKQGRTGEEGKECFTCRHCCYNRYITTSISTTGMPMVRGTGVAQTIYSVLCFFPMVVHNSDLF